MVAVVAPAERAASQLRIGNRSAADRQSASPATPRQAVGATRPSQVAAGPPPEQGVLWSPDAAVTPAFIQPKLGVGAVDHPLEREADHVANQVMSEPVHRKAPQSIEPNLGHIPPQINRLASASAPPQAVSESPAVVDQVLQSSGRPLDPAARSFFEPRFGYDFSQVRVHSDAGAAASARGIHARAYTAGNNLFFGAGEYAPSTSQGRALLAHELTHVVQQGGQAQSIQREPAKDKDDEDEDAAPTLNIPKPIDLTAINTANMCGPGGCVTDQKLDKRIEDLKDPELKKYEAEGKAADAKRKAEVQTSDATRHERFIRLMVVMKEKHYSPDDVRKWLVDDFSMRDLMVLKKYGFEFPSNAWTRSKIRQRVIDAVEAYDEDWGRQNQGKPVVQEENEKQDNFQTVVNQVAARERSAHDPAALDAIEGGPMGALGYGVGGNEGAKLASAGDSMMAALGGTVEARNSMPYSGGDPVQVDEIANVRPPEVNALDTTGAEPMNAGSPASVSAPTAPAASGPLSSAAPPPNQRETVNQFIERGGKVNRVPLGVSGLPRDKQPKPDKQITARPKDFDFAQQRDEQLGSNEGSPEVSAVNPSKSPGGKTQSPKAEGGIWAHKDLPRYLAHFEMQGDHENAAALRSVLNWPAGVKPNTLRFPMSDGRAGIPDGIDVKQGVVYELKPDTQSAWAQRGPYQASEYAGVLNRMRYAGRTDWRPVVITYNATALERLLRTWGVLRKK
jgi:hypothetical protein